MSEQIKTVIFEKATAGRLMMTSYRKKDGELMLASEVKDGNGRVLPRIGHFTNERMSFPNTKHYAGAIDFWRNSIFTAKSPNLKGKPLIFEINEEEAAKLKNTRLKSKAKVYRMVDEIAEDSAKVRRLAILLGCGPKLSEEKMLTRVFEALDDNFAKVESAISELGTDEGEFKQLFEESLGLGSIVKKASGYYASDEKLGASKDASIEALSLDEDITSALKEFNAQAVKDSKPKPKRKPKK